MLSQAANRGIDRPREMCPVHPNLHPLDAFANPGHERLGVIRQANPRVDTALACCPDHSLDRALHFGVLGIPHVTHGTGKIVGSNYYARQS